MNSSNTKVVGGLYQTVRSPLALQLKDYHLRYFSNHKIAKGDHVLVLANYVDRDGTEFVLILHNNITCYIESDSLDFPV